MELTPLGTEPFGIYGVFLRNFSCCGWIETHELRPSTLVDFHLITQFEPRKKGPWLFWVFKELHCPCGDYTTSVMETRRVFFMAHLIMDEVGRGWLSLGISRFS